MKKILSFLLIFIVLLIPANVKAESPYTIVSGDLETVGSVVKIADEEFYVIKNSDMIVHLLAKYNLRAGKNISNPTNRQDSSIMPSSTNDYTGGVAFSATKYWNTYSDTSNVYESNSNLYAIIQDYVTYLESTGITGIEGRTITYNDLSELGYTYTNEFPSGKEWLYSVPYWTSTVQSADGNYLYIVKTSNNLAIDHYTQQQSGVRPVITMPYVNYNISFNTNGGSELDEYDITPGKKIERPEDPTKNGFELEGWYTNEQLTNPYDFNTVPTDDVMLYAKWEKIVENNTQNEQVPSTGDNIMTYITILLITSLSLIGTGLYIKKKFN